jgi:hypothetical protein
MLHKLCNVPCCRVIVEENPGISVIKLGMARSEDEGDGVDCNINGADDDADAAASGSSVGLLLTYCPIAVKYMSARNLKSLQHLQQGSH